MVPNTDLARYTVYRCERLCGRRKQTGGPFVDNRHIVSSPLPPSKRLELFSGQRVSRHDKYPVPYFVGDVDHTQIPAIGGLSERPPGSLRGALIFRGVGKDLLRLGFGHAMVEDVRQSRFQVAKVADFHNHSCRHRG